MKRVIYVVLAVVAVVLMVSCTNTEHCKETFEIVERDGTYVTNIVDSNLFVMYVEDTSGTILTKTISVDNERHTMFGLNGTHKYWTDVRYLDEKTTPKIVYEYDLMTKLMGAEIYSKDNERYTIYISKKQIRLK